MTPSGREESGGKRERKEEGERERQRDDQTRIDQAEREKFSVGRGGSECRHRWCRSTVPEIEDKE